MIDDFDAWYEEQYPLVVSSVAAMTGSVEVAVDASAEAFVKSLEQWSRVSTMQSAGGWVYRVALNAARRGLRRRRFEDALLRRDRSETVPGPAGELWQLVATLPLRQREAVVLRHVAQLREAEIADAMGIRRGTVSRTLGEAYRSLRIQLEADCGTHEKGLTWQT